MIGPADIEAWAEEAEEAEASEATAGRPATERPAPPPSPFSLVTPMTTSFALPWRLALERRLARRRAG